MRKKTSLIIFILINIFCLQAHAFSPALKLSTEYTSREEQISVASAGLGYGGLNTSIIGLYKHADGVITKKDFYFREIYFDQSLSDRLDLSIGKKILKWGTAYAFNPAGVIEPKKNPADPEDRLGILEGKKLVTLDYIRNKFSLTLAGTNESPGELALRIYTLFGTTDIALIGVTRGRKNPELGFTFSQGIGDKLEIHAEVMERNLIFDSVIGINYTWENGLNIIGEYFQHFLFLMFSKSFDKFKNKLIIYQNINDSSRVISPETEYRFNPNFSAQLRLTAFSGHRVNDFITTFGLALKY